MLGTTLATQRALSHPEPLLSKRPFVDFPLQIADRWQGRELPLDSETLGILKLDDYMMRMYTALPRTTDSGGERGIVPQNDAIQQPSSEQSSPVILYVGYYNSQRTGSTYHSPKHCLPGGGWQFVNSSHVKVPVSGDQNIEINKVEIQNGGDEQVVLYWYQDRGRVIASEYDAKVYLFWDAITKNRTDGALVRISVPVSTTAEDAYQLGLGFLKDFWPLLGEFMPEPEKHAELPRATNSTTGL
jgi:EpsI family protein